MVNPLAFITETDPIETGNALARLKPQNPSKKPAPKMPMALKKYEQNAATQTPHW